VREYAPSEQVQARAELRGPSGRRGGIDIAGDGATTAFTGRIRRRVLEQRDGETVYAALARELAG